MRRTLIATTLATAIVAVCAAGASAHQGSGSSPGLWQVYDNALKGAKYVDLTHTITPSIPV